MCVGGGGGGSLGLELTYRSKGRCTKWHSSLQMNDANGVCLDTKILSLPPGIEPGTSSIIGN